MRSLILITLAVATLFLTGCATTSPKGELYSKMYNEMPKTVLVLPAVNHSTAADAPDLYSSTVAEPLANAGFYVLPIEVTDKFLKNEGLSTGEQLSAVPVQKLGKTFGADAVLYVTINKWDTNYYVVGGNVRVGIDYLLKSTKTGEELWSYSNETEVDTSGGNVGGGLLGKIIATAISTSTQDYVPLANRVNYMALNTIPYGEYHKLYGQDKGQAVYVPAKDDASQK